MQQLVPAFVFFFFFLAEVVRLFFAFLLTVEQLSPRVGLAGVEVFDGSLPQQAVALQSGFDDLDARRQVDRAGRGLNWVICGYCPRDSASSLAAS